MNVEVHDKVKAYTGFAIVALAVLVLIDRGTNLDLIPNDIETMFWTALVPIIVGLGGAWFTREGHGPTK